MNKTASVYRHLEGIAIRQEDGHVQLISRCWHDPGFGVRREYLTVKEFKAATKRDPPSAANLLDSFEWVDYRHQLEAEYSDQERTLIYTVPATFTVETHQFPGFSGNGSVLAAPGREVYLTMQGDYSSVAGTEYEVKDLMIGHNESILTFNLGDCTVTTCGFEGPKDYTRLTKYLLRNSTLKLVRHCPAGSWVVTEPDTGRRVAVAKDNENFLQGCRGGNWPTHFRPMSY
jgi:hypothetical protein